MFNERFFSSTDRWSCQRGDQLCSFLPENFGRAYVAVPYHPDAEDEKFPFPVIRYRSFDTTELLNYRAGYPFSVSAMKDLKEVNCDLIHSHCPFMSTVLARILRRHVDVPLVFTYHTKFDIIAKTIKSGILQKQAVSLIVDNINACDEVWTVSEGAGENLRSLGYKGDYIVMQNGVEYSKRPCITGGYTKKQPKELDLPEGVPVYLFVGKNDVVQRPENCI